jgi:hypothetical protein
MTSPRAVSPRRARLELSTEAVFGAMSLATVALNLKADRLRPAVGARLGDLVGEAEVAGRDRVKRLSNGAQVGRVGVW